jgi:predicted PurR-regulated permease PerM
VSAADGPEGPEDDAIEASGPAADPTGAGERVPHGSREPAPRPPDPVLIEEHADLDDPQPYGALGPPLARHSPFYVGFFGGLGVVLAVWVAGLIAAAHSVLLLIVVAMFIAVGLSPVVDWLVRRGMRRRWAVLIVCVCVVGVMTLFAVAIVPVIADQINAMITNAPEWLDRLGRNRALNDLDAKYHILDTIKDQITGGALASAVAGGLLGFGKFVLSAVFNTFIIFVLTLYFLASLPQIKRAAYGLAPATRRVRVSTLGDQILAHIGRYVAGAVIVALCAGLSSLVFLYAVGLSQYAVALAVVVAVLDFLPMIGATIGAVIVCAIAFATDLHTGIACVVFYVVYQQIENYVIAPKVMSNSVDVPGAVTVIAALLGGALLGVVGALIAIPTAAAILLVVKEVVIKRQDQL